MTTRIYNLLLVLLKRPLCLPDDIMDPKALQGEDDGSQAGPLDLRNGVLRHALLPELPAVDPEALPSTGPSSPACPLFRLSPSRQTTAQQLAFISTLPQ